MMSLYVVKRDIYIYVWLRIFRCCERLFAPDGYGDHVGHHQGLGDGPVDGAFHHGLQGGVAHQLGEVLVFHGQLGRVQEAEHQAADPHLA